MFAALGFWGSVPVIHTLWLNHTTWHMRIAFVYVALHGAINLTCAAIYVARIPEKWKPGRFDIFLSSHQWFHFTVVGAALVHLSAMKLLLEWRDSSGGVCAVPFTQWPSSWTPSGSSESMDACKLFINFLTSCTKTPPPSHVVAELPTRSPLHEAFLTSCPKTPPPSHVVAELPTRSPLHEAFLTSCTKTPPPSHVVTELPTRRLLHTAYSVAPPPSWHEQCSATAFMA
eukprot:gene29981-18053_t